MAIVGLAGVLAFGLWLRSQVVRDSKAFMGFCGATHVGETWEHVQARAALKDWSFVRQSKQGQPSEEWLCRAEIWGYHAGCVVTVAKGRVIGSKFAELPE